MRASWSTAVLCAALVACGPRDAARDTAEAGDSVTVAAPSWVSELGPVLAIPGDSEHIALVLSGGTPDTTGPAMRLGRPGAPFASPVAADVVRSDSLACDAPTLRLRGTPLSNWTIGVASQEVVSVALDSLDALTGADSSALTADVARAASALAPPDSRFRGLPFVVLKVYRIRQADRSTLLATVLRRLPQEATPFEARGFLVAERVGDAPYSVKYGVRSEGAEETVDHFAVLGVLRVGAKEFAVVEREQQNGTRYEILERSASGDWQVRWSRALAC